MTRLILSAALVALATAGVVVACRHEAPIGVPREVPPMGPRPDPVQPAVLQRTLPCTRCPDAGLVGAQLDPVALRVAQRELDPAAVEPPHDAGIDSEVSLPPIPDARFLSDAAVPLR